MKTFVVYYKFNFFKSENRVINKKHNNNKKNIIILLYCQI